MYLGDLSVSKIEEIIGVPLPLTLVDFMNSRRQLNANNIKKGRWHCFIIPFAIVCGDIDTARFIYDELKPLEGKFNCQLKIEIENQQQEQ